MEQHKKSAESQGQTFPQAGTPEYEAVKATVVKGLVERAGVGARGERWGSGHRSGDRDRSSNQLKEQYGLTDEQKYQASSRRPGSRTRRCATSSAPRILTNKIYEAVTKNVTVSDADIQAYYDKNSSHVQQPASRRCATSSSRRRRRRRSFTTRSRRRRLRDAREEVHPGQASKADGGKFTAFKGRTVAPFDKFVFSAKTASSPIRSRRSSAGTSSRRSPPSSRRRRRRSTRCKDQIKTTLLQTKQNAP
jgi:hypothetical protein